MSDLLIDGKVLLEDIKGVIFDKDGTLIDIHHYWSSVIKLRASLLTKKWFSDLEKENIQNVLIDLMGFDFNTSKMKPEGPIGIKPRVHIVSIVADFIRQYDHEITNAEVEFLFREADDISSQNMDSFLKVLPGVRELLIKLDDYGVQSFIATTDITSRARLAMKTLKFDVFFKNVIGADLVANSKPAPDLANLALKGVDYSASNVVVIGDHPIDIQMGENIKAGLNIGVLTGISSASMFKNFNCSVVKDLSSVNIS